MSAYKTVNKRADPKRNFTASLACSGYSGKTKKRRMRERGIEAGFRKIKEGKIKRTNHVQGRERGKVHARKDKTNWEMEKTRGIEEREKIRAHELAAASAAEREREKGWKREEEIEEAKERRRRIPRVRERRDTRERLCRGYMEMLVKYIIPA